MSGAVPPLPHYAFMAWCSVKAQGQLYLTLLSKRITADRNRDISEILSVLMNVVVKQNIFGIGQ
jgi:hypothetical protein